MNWLTICFTMFLSDCDRHIYSYGDPPDSVFAVKCGVSESEFIEARDLVLKQPPYSDGRVGRCDLIRDDSPYVVVITPEIQLRVELMLAREAAEKRAKDAQTH